MTGAPALTGDAYVVSGRAVSDPVESPGFVSWVDGLARQHTRDLTGLAAREGLGPDEALDAVQEAFATFLSLPQARGLSRHRDDSFAFLTVIVRNAARNIRKRHHRARPHDALDAASLVDDSPTTDVLIANAERHVAVLGCVQQLGKVQKQVVTLRMLEELTGTEVARQLGLSPAHIAVVLHRAKEALRQCLAE